MAANEEKEEKEEKEKEERMIKRKREEANYIYLEKMDKNGRPKKTAQKYVGPLYSYIVTSSAYRRGEMDKELEAMTIVELEAIYPLIASSSPSGGKHCRALIDRKREEKKRKREEEKKKREEEKKKEEM